MKKKLLIVMAGLMLAITQSFATGTPTVYTDEATYLAALGSNYYLEDFSSYSDGQALDYINFSSGDFSYKIAALDYSCAYTFSGLAVFSGGNPLRINNINGAVNAFGGYFFAVDPNISFVSTNITVTVGSYTYTFASTSQSQFVGFIFPDIISDNIDITNDKWSLSTCNEYTSMDHFYVGSNIITSTAGTQTYDVSSYGFSNADIVKLVCTDKSDSTAAVVVDGEIEFYTPTAAKYFVTKQSTVTASLKTAVSPGTYNTTSGGCNLTGYYKGEPKYFGSATEPITAITHFVGDSTAAAGSVSTSWKALNTFLGYDQYGTTTVSGGPCYILAEDRNETTGKLISSLYFDPTIGVPGGSTLKGPHTFDIIMNPTNAVISTALASHSAYSSSTTRQSVALDSVIAVRDADISMVIANVSFMRAYSTQAKTYTFDIATLSYGKFEAGDVLELCYLLGSFNTNSYDDDPSSTSVAALEANAQSKVSIDTVDADGYITLNMYGGGFFSLTKKSISATEGQNYVDVSSYGFANADIVKLVAGTDSTAAVVVDGKIEFYTPTAAVYTISKKSTVAASTKSSIAAITNTSQGTQGSYGGVLDFGQYKGVGDDVGTANRPLTALTHFIGVNAVQTGNVSSSWKQANTYDGYNWYGTAASDRGACYLLMEDRDETSGKLLASLYFDPDLSEVGPQEVMGPHAYNYIFNPTDAIISSALATHKVYSGNTTRQAEALDSVAVVRDAENTMILANVGFMRAFSTKAKTYTFDIKTISDGKFKHGDVLQLKYLLGSNDGSIYHSSLSTAPEAIAALEANAQAQIATDTVDADGYVKFNIFGGGFFTIARYLPVIYSASNGTISVSCSDTTVLTGSSLPCRSILNITATPVTGYQLDSIMVNGAKLSDTSYTIVDTTEITAAFSLIQLPISISAENGSVSISADGVNISSGSTVPYGTEIAISATPATGYVLDSVTVNSLKLSAETYVVTDSIDITAAFSLQYFTVIYGINGNGSLEVSSESGNIETGSSVGYGTELSLTATAEDGYQFDSLVIDGDIITDANTTITVTGDVSIASYFSEKTSSVSELSANKIWVSSKENTIVVHCNAGSMLQVYNVSGVLVSSLKAQTTDESIAVPQRGLYIVRITAGTGKIDTKKCIVQ